MDSLIKDGVHPYFILTPKGHLGYERIVGGYLEGDIPIHFVGLPLELTRGHGQTWSVEQFVGHDLSHGTISVANKINILGPLARPIFRSICDDIPAGSPLRRELMVALYFWLHELEPTYADYVRTHLDKPVHTIGKDMLNMAKQDFMGMFLNKFWETASHCEPFRLPDNIGFSVKMVPDTCRIEDRTMHLEATLSKWHETEEFHLERHAYIIELPAEISGSYKVTFRMLESYMDVLTTKHGVKALKPYKEALERFYGNCEHVDGVYSFTLASLNQDALKDYFNRFCVDEMGTKAFVETGTYDPTPPPYTWDTVSTVQQLYNRIFTTLQTYADPIWRENGAIIDSLRSALDRIAERSAEAGAGAGAGASAGGAGAGAAS